MPIKGLTDQQASFPQIGTLRKGAKKPNEKRPGADLTYFRLDTSDGAVQAAFNREYGSEPRDINCFLPFQTTDQNFETSREAWTAGALQHRCDGEMVSLWLKADGTYSQQPTPCPGGCKPSGRLKIIIPELRRMAYITVLTTSLHDIMELHKNLSAYEMLRGDLRGIPFVLKRRPKQVSTPEVELDKQSQNYGKPTGKRVRREKWLLSIEAAPVWVNAQLTAMQQAALPEGDELEAPDDPDDIMIVDPTTGEILSDDPPALSAGPEPEPPEPEKPDFGGNGALEGFLLQVAMEIKGMDDQTAIAILKALGKTGFNKKNPNEADYLIALIKEQLEQPTTEPALLHVVNTETDGYYKHIHHLRNAVLKAADVTWPPPSPDDWRAALVVAVQHASAPHADPETDNDIPF